MLHTVVVSSSSGMLRVHVNLRLGTKKCRAVLITTTRIVSNGTLKIAMVKDGE